ncbi:MAG: DUF2809 domain-containing protein [Clostridia bacterium]|nr:DUF2809 domain-containing protein [Clostridia bacterium]MDR3644374.1 DUF2809 domain-containing protein [Clostridia bacterium]
MKPTVKRRLLYLLLFVLLTAVEVFIAVFVHDTFVRPYLGDILVVIDLYCFVRIFIPENLALLPLYIFLFAAAVECSQLFHLATLLGLHNRCFRVILGSSFDVIDILCYLAGCILLAGWEIWQHKRR